MNNLGLTKICINEYKKLCIMLLVRSVLRETFFYSTTSANKRTAQRDGKRLL